MANEDEHISQSLADTQPVTNSQEAGLLENELSPISWGQLYPLSLEQKSPYNLINDTYSVGRAYQCDIILSECDVGKTLYLQISKHQFSITRVRFDSGSVVSYITDHSTNGTFVNGKKIINKKMQIISNNDVISITNKKNKVFMFMDFNNYKDGIPDEVKRQYLISDVIGRGSFGEVRQVFEKETTNKFAMKSVKIECAGSTDVYNEIIVLYKSCHENIVRMHDIMKTENQIFIVLELMEGGDLSHRLAKCKHLSESAVKHILYQCSLGLHYLHNKKIIHRDMKPANILLSSNDEYPIAKISDFGLAKLLTHSTTQLHTICGTPNYAAPELMYYKISTYNSKVDVWSLGVILYLCLSGQLPFNKQRTDMPLDAQIKAGSYHFRDKIWDSVSSEAIQIIRSMLITFPQNRISLNDLLYESWFDEEMKSNVHDMTMPQKRKVIDELYFPKSKRLSSST